jgi:phage repressor protein C with HTH and peptisase S24 domain
MLTHSQIWTAIDSLAEREGFSVSSLAKRAGLDATTFNRSKRMNAEGQPRWPSTESIAKILAATGVGIDDFIQLTRSSKDWLGRTLPLLPFLQARQEHFDASGRPRGDAWENTPFPQVDGAELYALELRGNDYLPVYRDGATLIIGVDAPLRRGDRVVIHRLDGTLELGVYGRQNAASVSISALNGTEERQMPLESLRVISRILWASQ